MTTSAITDQLEYWNGPVGERWASLQERIDGNIAAISDALLRFAAAKPGERVLDVGCGCGTTSFALEKAVGAKGGVLGADISKPMLAVARARAKAMRSRVEFVEADATISDFGGRKFDLVFSRFGLMFFADPVAAFANLARAMDAKARFAFVCWRPFAENDWSYVPYQAALPLLPPQEPSDPHAPGPFAFADAGRVKTILVRAGLKDVSIGKLDTAMYMGRTVESAAEESLNIGPLARAATGLSDETRAKIREVVEKAYKPYVTPDGVKPPAACWLVGAGV